MKEAAIKKYNSVYKSEKGASLIEILVVLLIVAIVCVIALPQISASLQSNRVNTLNALIAAKLAEARIQAIKRNSQVSVKINFQTRRVWIEAGGAPIGSGEFYAPENTIQLSSGATSTEGTITFNSFGNLQTSPTSVKVSNTKINRSKTLQVSLSGKITVGAMGTAQ